MVLKESAPPTIDQSPPKERLPSYFQIAIDGPMGSGKTTVSELVAKALKESKFLFVSTGQLYRALTLLAFRAATFDGKLNEEKLQLLLDDEAALLQLLFDHVIRLEPASSLHDKACVFIDDEDVTHLLNTKIMSKKTPVAARHKLVREEVVKRQQALVEASNVIMEGRDITHKVLPGAQLKIYLDADENVRAHRRYLDLVAENPKLTEEDVLADLRERDAIDSEKNLKFVPGVWKIDTTEMSIDEVVKLICDRVLAMTGKLL